MIKDVEFIVGKETLRGKLYIPEVKGPFPGVIFFHGSGSSGDTYHEASKILMKKGILTFMFNFRGCGISDGDFKEQTIGMGLDDANAGLDYFLSLSELDKDRVGIAGSSFGGFLAAFLSSDFDFKSLVLINPASYSPSKMNAYHSDDSNDNKKNFEKSMSYNKIHRFKNNLLIIQSELDDILPEGMAEKYVEESKDNDKMKHYIIKDAKHRIKLNPKAKKDLLSKLESWFMETL